MIKILLYAIKNISIRILFGCIFILFAIYQLCVIHFYNQFTGFDYSGLFLILLFMTAGIMQFVERKKPIETRKKRTLWMQVLFITITVCFLIFSKLNQEKHIEKMYQIEKSKVMVK